MQINYYKLFNEDISKDINVLISEHVSNSIKIKDYKHILIPSLIYKVILPNLPTRELNFFQKTILELLSIQNFDIKYLSDILILESEFIEYIIKELESLEYYHKGLVTPKGHKALQNTYESSNTITGYCIYDLLSNRFFDYFILEDELKNMYINYDGYRISFDISKKGKSAEVISIIEKELDIEIKKEYVYESYSLYLNNLKKYTQMDNISMHDAEIIEYDVDIDKISIFNDYIPCYVVTYLYNNTSNVNRGINVSNPFFNRIDSELNKSVLDNDKIKNKNIVNSLSDNTLSDSERELNFQNRKDAYHKNIQNIFNMKFIKSNTKLLDYCFFELLFSNNKLNNEYDNSNASNKMKILEDFIKNLSESFEYLFYHNLNKAKLKRTLITKDKNSNMKILLKIALDIGFINDDNSIEKFFSKIFKGRLFDKNDILKNDIEDMASLCAVNLLICNENDDFNFHKLSDNYNNLFVILNKLKHIRNVFSHDDYEFPKIEELKYYFKYFLGVFEILLDTKINHDYFNNNIIIEETNKNYDERNKMAYDAVIKNIDNKKIEDYEYETIFTYLIRMQYNFDDNKDVYINITKILEQLLNIIINDIGKDSLFKFVYDKLQEEDKGFIDKISNHLNDIGFYTPNNIPDFFIRRWKGAFSYKRIKNRLVFSDLLMIILIYINFNDLDLFKNLSKSCPYFFDYIIKYGDRAHNSSISKSNSLNLYDYKQAVETTYLCVKSVIDLI